MQHFCESILAMEAVSLSMVAHPEIAPISSAAAATRLMFRALRAWFVSVDSSGIRDQIGSTVVYFISESAMLEVTSWTPGSCDSLSKKNRS